uniref:Uncharacterized protein TCIL3000_11_15100 n=1 Tax=Trypanosoma congolense (strain IL3000) TaxID=1068625 RepID=G0V2X0_TRYCI|nr:unnamed protein product [Trypanosoma congolense IL3000]
MFAEVDFNSDSDGDDSSVPGMSSAGATLTHESSDCPTVAVAGGRCVAVRFHQPGELGFACVAGATNGEDSVCNEELVNGDLWVNDQCHCVKCEVLQASLEISVLQEKMIGSNSSGSRNPVVILLDLDNYGFNQFRSVPPRREKATKFDLLQHVFVWCFFGSCFTRYHGVLPNAETVCKSFHESNEEYMDRLTRNTKHRGGKESIWKRLVEDGRVHFTACGGHNQGADSVILQIAYAMIHMPLIVVSGDKAMLRAITECRRTVGKKSTRQALENDYISKLVVIDVCTHRKKLLPVWKCLETEVCRIVGRQ